MNPTSATSADSYVLDGTDTDLQRLLAIADVTADLTRTSLQRAGVGRGWRAVDCGCGPLGALPILAELVGTDGHVVGVDSNNTAISDARRHLDALHVEPVELIAIDALQLEPEMLGGPVDIISTRCFLMHQRDPAAILRHLTGLLRPGGWLVALEPLPTPAPMAHPPHTSLTAAWDLLHDTIRAAGIPEHAVAALPQHAAAAGLTVTHASVTSVLMPPGLGFELHAATLDAATTRATDLAVATASQCQALTTSLRDAIDAGYQWVSTPHYLDLTLQRADDPTEA
jgi:SAM-dependent methyltransferase